MMNVHPNEVALTKYNLETLLEEATQLGQRYVDALHEQMERQGATHAPSGKN